MKVNVKYLNIHPTDALEAWVKEQLEPLSRSRQIDEATVRFVRSTDASPAFQVNVHLVTPGPDVFAETRDHTLHAACVKAVDQVREEIMERAAKRTRRLKSNLSAPRPHPAS